MAEVVTQTSKAPITIKTDTAEVTVNPFGAHVTSWKVDGEEVMFVSSLAKYDGSRPIRGGVPLVFPQFGPGPIKQHGFARRCYWEAGQPTYSESDGKKSASISFSLKPNAYTKDMWNHEFSLAFVVTIQGKDLQMDMHVENTGSVEWNFTCCYHTYFCVKDISQVGLDGLKGATYLDSLQERKKCTEENEQVKFAENVDRVYRNISWPVSFHNGSKKVSLTANVADCVVWNPWAAKAQAMEDFADEEYKQMVCVEPAQGIDPLNLKPTEKFTFQHTITVE